MANYNDHPAAPPPPGVVPNSGDSISKGPSFVILGIFVSLAFLAVLIRVFVRLRLTKSWGWDDSACIVASIGSLSFAILYIEVTNKNPVKHIWDIDISSFPSAIESQSLSVNGISYQITTLFTKLSILLLYLRLFGVNKNFALSVIISIVILILIYIPLAGIEIGFLVACNDLTALTENRFCRDSQGTVLLLNASFNVITDLWLFLLPFPLLMKLQLQPRRRLGLIAVFATGLGACAASLARLIEIVINYWASDFIWSQATFAEFSIVEINIGIIVACVSSFPAFFGQVRDWLRPTGSSKPIQAQSPDSDSDQIAQRTIQQAIRREP